MLADLRAAARHLGRCPGHVAAGLLSLGASIAICVSAFSLFNTLVFREIPGIVDRERLIRVQWTDRRGLFTTAEFDAVESQRPASFDAIAAQGTHELPVRLPSGPAVMSVAFVSARFFETLGTRALQGRLLDADDAERGAPVAVISEGLWRSAFNADARAIGGALIVGGRVFTVAGVTPAAMPGLRVIDLGNRESDYPGVWLPRREAIAWKGTPRLATPWLSVAGRLTERAPLVAARAEVAVLEPRLANMTSPRRRAALQVFRSGLDWRDEPSDSLLALLLYLALPLGVVAIGCVNVVNLQLAWAMDRAGELSVRLALGASPLRLMRLLIVETALVAGLATAVGWAGARLILARLASFFPATVAVDRDVFLFVSCLIVMVIGAGGVLPAWLTSRDVIAAGLKLGQGTRGRTRMRGLLVVVQVAASIALVVFSDLALRSILVRMPPIPVNAARILVADINLTDVHPAEPRSREFLDTLLDHLRNNPTIEAAGFSTLVVTGHQLHYRLPADGPDMRRLTTGGYVTSDWFAATQATFLMGRAPSRHITAAREVVVNAAFAASLPRTIPNVLGLRMEVSDVPSEVVGVVGDTDRSPSGAPVPMVFAPMLAPPAAVVLVALARDLSAGRAAMTSAIHAADPAVPFVRIDALDVRMTEHLRGMREGAWFGLFLGLLALTLAGAGLHSLLSYIIRRRTREIGIRLTMGARTPDVVWLFLRPALTLLLAGAACGVSMAIVIARVMRAALPGVSALDGASLLTTAAILGVVAVLATSAPAYRASRVDPVEALRSE